MSSKEFEITLLDILKNPYDKEEELRKIIRDMGFEEEKLRSMQKVAHRTLGAVSEAQNYFTKRED